MGQAFFFLVVNFLGGLQNPICFAKVIKGRGIYIFLYERSSSAITRYTSSVLEKGWFGSYASIEGMGKGECFISCCTYSAWISFAFLHTDSFPVLSDDL